MTIRLTKPWIDLAQVDLSSIPAQLGVFQLAGADGHVVYIGYGGGREPFGLRSAIQRAAGASGAQEPARLVRYEVTHGYLSRWEELLMVHDHDFGRLPVGNADAVPGRLTPSDPGS